MKITINKNEVVTKIAQNPSEWITFANTMPNEHYSLLCYLSTLFDNITILDIGTWAGWSAISLAQNNTNQVITYDIVDELNRTQGSLYAKDIFLSYKNIERKLMDVRTDDHQLIKSAPMIVLDIDPHDGIQELDFTNFLTSINYTGFVLCDDINLNDGMKSWWNSLLLPKYDLTDVGHYSGTGLICYGNVHANVIELG